MAPNKKGVKTGGGKTAAGKKADPNSGRKKKLPDKTQQQKKKKYSDNDNGEGGEIDLSTSSTAIPLTLQQLLLNVFKYGLLEQGQQQEVENKDEEGKKEVDIKSLIQTIKSHLYNRDFDSAFADADPQLLRAYALRWSASRALGYAGILRAVVRDAILQRRRRRGRDDTEDTLHVLCIGGGAGAEIVALAGVWRDLLDEQENGDDEHEHGPMDTDKDNTTMTTITAGVEDLSLNDDEHDRSAENVEEETETEKEAKSAHTLSRRHHARQLPKLSITAVDIADWSTVIAQLSQTIHSSAVPGSKAHPAPLLRPQTVEEGTETEKRRGSSFDVSFQRLDVLALADEELRALLWRDTNTHRDDDHHQTAADSTGTALITLMFTLNELFAASMAKTTQFLLRLTDLAAPGTTLLVVDSPGSYSTLSLGKKSSSNSGSNSSDDNGGNGNEKSGSAAPARHYPMKFLLDHTLLSIAVDKWERILSDDSRWFRRDAARLRYDVGGEGAVRLEDMRYQIHVYRRLP